MPSPKHTPERKSRSGSHVPNSLRGTVRLEIRCAPDLAERAREVAEVAGLTLAQVLCAGVDATEAALQSSGEQREGNG